MNRIKTENFKYQKLSQDEQKARGILGRLVGVCADFNHATRNDRKYNEQLWENVFNSDLMKEKIANKVCFGELGHPADREEVDMEKIAICLTEQPVKNDQGQLVAVFDILNTPNGKILKALCDYGSNIGISSRGTGDLYTDENGDESVDPDTYNCECFDAVLIPAVKEARLQYVTECLNTKKYNKTLKQRLHEEVEKAPEEDHAIMTKTLSDLGISLEDEKQDDLKEEKLDESSSSYTNAIKAISDCVFEEGDEDKEILKNHLQDIVNFCKDLANDYDILLEECNNESCSQIDEAIEPEVVDDESNEELTAEFQEALQKLSVLEKDNLSLQEKLSVCNAKEKQLESIVAKYKNATINLSEEAKKAKGLAQRVNKLEESLRSKDYKLQSINTKLDESSETCNRLRTKLSEAVKKMSNYEKDFKSLNEQLENKESQLVDAAQKNKRLRAALQESKDSYLNTKAEMYGLSSKEVQSKLNESYSLKDIDKVCKSISNQKLNLNNMSIKFNNPQVKSFKTGEDNFITRNIINNDDEVTSTLLDLLD